jgi:hypothetical protein
MAAVHDHRGGVDLSCRVAGVLQDLARRDAHPVVGRSHVDQVRRMHIQRHARCLQYLRVLAGFGLLPALRVAEEELHHVGAVSLGRGQGIVLVDVRTNKHGAKSRRAARQPGDVNPGPVQISVQLKISTNHCNCQQR